MHHLYFPYTHEPFLFIFLYFSENLRKRFKTVFQELLSFLKFFKIFENLRNCSEIIGKSMDIIGTVRKHSQELKSFRADFESPQKDPA